MALTTPSYTPAPGFFDELFDAPDRPGSPADALAASLAQLGRVKIGHGRFYGDVAPIRGVYKGAAATSEHDVNVKMTRFTK